MFNLGRLAAMNTRTVGITVVRQTISTSRGLQGRYQGDCELFMMYLTYALPTINYARSIMNNKPSIYETAAFFETPVL